MSHKDPAADATGGIHYHYHFYGPGAQPAEAAQNPNASAPQPPFPGFPPQGMQPGPNPHPHPGADSLVKGLAVGAGAAWLLTSEPAQRVLMRTAVQLWATLQGGIEELKERYHDAEAEAEAAMAPPPEPEPAPEPKRRSGPRPVKG